MAKVIASLLLVLSLYGCAGVLTTPTGVITIDRQEFINTYAVVKVMYKRLMEDARFRCADDAVCLARVDRTNEEAKALDIQIQAKIEVPESQIAWGTVLELLKAITSLVP